VKQKSIITKKFLQESSIKTIPVQDYSIQANHSSFSFKMRGGMHFCEEFSGHKYCIKVKQMTKLKISKLKFKIKKEFLQSKRLILRSKHLLKRSTVQQDSIQKNSNFI
jgi:hypothetical protein